MAHDNAAALRKLLEEASEGGLDAARHAELEKLLDNNPEAQQAYVRHMHLNACLRWDLGAAAEARVLGRLQGHARGSVAAPGVGRHAIRRRLLATGLAAAVLLLVAWTLWNRLGKAPPGDPETSFAVLAGVVEVRWQDGEPQRAAGAGLGRETLRLLAGCVRLEFARGASVSLEGPAELTIQAADHAVLRRGRLAANVPREAIGFRIDTPAMQVVDLGTSFGVAVEESGVAEVCVFEGEVEATSSRSGNALAVRIQEGEAARASAVKGDVTAIPYDAARFERVWPITFGVLNSSGVVRFIPPGPALRPRSHRDPKHLIVFPERPVVTLPDDLTVTVTEAGRHVGPFEGRTAVAPKGARARSYLLQFHPGGGMKSDVHRLHGSITFDRPIVAVIATTSHLSATDALLGAEGSRHSEKARGIEAGDAFEIGPDRRSLAVDWTAAAGVDQLRILVVAP